MRTKVVNIYKEEYDVYIGREGKGKNGYFGNPIKLKNNQIKGSTLLEYKKYFYERLEKDYKFKQEILSLKGKTLGCFCKPNPCHGDIIAEYLENMKIKKLNLPKKYKYEEGKSRPEYKKYHGRNKLSYSQYNSFKDIEKAGYKGNYLAGYFMHIPDSGNVFSEYGGWCGEYIEKGVDESNNLSKKDKEILDSIDRPKDTEYEKEIVIDMLPYGYDFVVQGFIDERFKNEGVSVVDYKTGNASKKVEFYSDEDYGQTTLYCLAETLEGNEIEYSGVRLFGRKGNGSDKYPLYLTGEVIEIPTPYSKERAEKLVKDICKIAEQISDYYKVYLKYFK